MGKETQKIYICTDDTGIYGNGITLSFAYSNYEYNGGENRIENCTFYEAIEIEVEAIIKKKEN